MVAMVLTAYDGVLSLLFQPIMAALFSSLATSLALVAGLLLRIPFVGRLWRHRLLIPRLLIATGLFVLVFGFPFGWTSTYPASDFDEPQVVLKPELLLGGSFAIIFSIANWPLPFSPTGFWSSFERNS